MGLGTDLQIYVVDHASQEAEAEDLVELEDNHQTHLEALVVTISSDDRLMPGYTQLLFICMARIGIMEGTNEAWLTNAMKNRNALYTARYQIQIT